MAFDGDIIIFRINGLRLSRTKGSQQGKVQLYQIYFNRGRLSMMSGEGFCFDIR